jgi:hypothetical protein
VQKNDFPEKQEEHKYIWNTTVKKEERKRILNEKSLEVHRLFFSASSCYPMRARSYYGL